MGTLEVKSFDVPDEVRGRTRFVALSGARVGRAVLEPGWRWSVHSKPVVGGSSCRTAHIGYLISGHLRVRMDDGTEGEIGAGSACQIPAMMRGSWATKRAPLSNSFLKSVRTIRGDGSAAACSDTDRARVLPMELRVGDRLTDETGEWEVIGRPYTTAGGKNARVRVQRVGEPAVTALRTWGAHERIAVTRA
jgi:hypothetical protein